MSTIRFIGMICYSSFQQLVANTKSAGHIARGCIVSAAMFVSAMSVA